ncbi:major facilitator superfamily domain-containing protein [Boletus edulis BED1]|uniref:Major facilitator superfamily domain-containing protein n=1 Tax=Boletus edulis BED1 TaxID=1328754 RepID=A0AAD4G7I9_BOLED|nr:major facilitator superfamily domain-containing protein [Boletus edulis BED1]
MTVPSLDQAPSETTGLLRDLRPTDRSGRSPSGERFRISPETLLAPIALATRLASQAPATTLVELIRRLTCKLWNLSHVDPVTLQAGGPDSAEQCDAPEIARYFATVIAIVGVIEGIILIVGCGILSRISSRYGRKPAFLLVLVAGTIGCCMISGSQYVADWLSDWVFIVGMIFLLSSGGSTYAYLVNVYIVDVCVPEDRTAALSKISGWTLLGNCISFALGGFITTKTGNPLIVFYMTATIYVSTLTYVVFVLPESFPEESRSALSRTLPKPPDNGHPVTTRFISLHIFEPLKMLIPTRRLDGTRNWRLAWCAAHIFVFTAVNAYVLTAWLVLVTSKYNLTPADTGIFFTTVAVSGTIALTVILPPLVRLLRPYYPRKIASSLLAEEDTINGEEPESETSDRLDVHLVFVSCVYMAVFYLTAAASDTSQALILSGICIGFGSIHTPTIRSLVAGSVHPLKQGEALAAFEMASNSGAALSPIVMGSILTATIGTMPLLSFYVHLVVMLISGALLFLIRDMDRYQKPREGDVATHVVN